MGISTLHNLENPDWELIGSRTYDWSGDEVLRCRHWDKVAIRWHFCTTGSLTGKERCETGIDWAGPQEEPSRFPSWHNAFTYVHLPNKTESKYVRLSLPGMGRAPVKVEAITPLRIDLDWRWTSDEKSCNNFTVRMSAMSTIEKHRLGELERFCRRFDLDHFIDCHNL
ncbi:unnamed protein product, partial [Mesorhabditis belari]|uniref:Uncharacterized protein n=1 Tax=Mesorhabditis belari TaxID=2138241 RepID=A0AAF3EA86_9BILA